MITKIHIEKVASYKTPAVLETDKKVNVVYGLNGSGKSTLSNYLYQTETSEYCNCSVDIADDVSLYVYNQRFIEEHFFEADALRGIFSLSKENKDIEKKVEAAQSQLDAQLAIVEREKNLADSQRLELAVKRDNACAVTWEIKKTYTGGDRVFESFLDGLKGNKETLFSHLSSITKPDEKPTIDIAKLKQDLETIQGESAQQYSCLSKVDFHEHSVESDSVFEQVIVGNANSSVAALIEKLQNSDWVRKGMSYIDVSEEYEASTCPFCQSNTISNEFASQIENYFDESYDASINHILRLELRYANALAKIASLESYNSNPLVMEQLPKLSQRHGLLIQKLEDNIRKIKLKRNTPSSSVTLKSTLKDVENLNAAIETVNRRIAKHNERFDNVEVELKLLKQQFWSLLRWDYDQTIAAFESLSIDSNLKICGCVDRENEASDAAKKKRAEIIHLQKSTVNISEAVDKINEGLVQIGISDFSIAKHDESLYKIVRSGNSSAEFSSLSEGEKMIISFLYFCELCKGKRNVADVGGKKIAVIDDPISSLSHIFVFNIGRLIKNEFFDSDTFEQVFVLTHSLYFFYELADSNHIKRKEKQKLFRLFKNSDGSQIVKMKYEEVQNDYHSYWSIVTDSNQPPALIANCMRNIVEYFFNFVQKQDLSNVVQKPELQANKYQSFCRYINRESHSLGQNIFDYKEFDYESFRDGLKLVFETTGYSEHYIKMTSVMGPK